MDGPLEKQEPVPLNAGTGSEVLSLAAGAKDKRPTRTTQDNWGKRNPLARWAHRAFESALKRGLVERQPCEECGEPDTEFHHFPDRYDEPLTGRHLCRRHHRKEHARLRRRNGGGDG